MKKGVKPGRETQMARARANGIMCVMDLMMPSCATVKAYRTFASIEETKFAIYEIELKRKPPLFPRPTVLDILGSHLSYVEGQRVHKIANVTPRLSPHGRPRRPKPIKRKPSLWTQRPTSAHRAGQSAEFYRAGKAAAALQAKTEPES